MKQHIQTHLRAEVLKGCADQPSAVFTSTFNLFNYPWMMTGTAQGVRHPKNVDHGARKQTQQTRVNACLVVGGEGMSWQPYTEGDMVEGMTDYLLEDKPVPYLTNTVRTHAMELRWNQESRTLNHLPNSLHILQQCRVAQAELSTLLMWNTDPNLKQCAWTIL